MLFTYSLSFITVQVLMPRAAQEVSVPSLQQLLSHGEEVHGVLDDAAVSRYQSGVDGFKERPGLRVSLHLH